MNKMNEKLWLSQPTARIVRVTCSHLETLSLYVAPASLVTECERQLSSPLRRW